MASEAKPFASLSSGLLARKGAARPAMRPQGFAQGAPGLEDLGWNDMGFEPPKAAEAPRDLDHDAFGDDVVEHPRAHPTGLTPVGSPVHNQQAEIEDRLGEDDIGEEFDETAEPYEPDAVETAEAEVPAVLAPAPRVVAAPAPRRAPRPRSAPGSKGKAAFTLRLDPDRHLKLRLACAVDGRSAQQLVTDALDQLLGRMPELELDGLEGQTQGVKSMSSALRFGTAASAIALASMLAGCAAPQQKTSFGGRTDDNVGLATRALMALNSNDVPAAIDYAERAVAKTPDDAGFRAILGNAYLKAGRFWSAEAAFKELLDDLFQPAASNSEARPSGNGTRQEG